MTFILFAFFFDVHGSSHESRSSSTTMTQEFKVEAECVDAASKLKNWGFKAFCQKVTK